MTTFVSDAHIRPERDFGQGSAERRKIQLQSMSGEYRPGFYFLFLRFNVQ